MEVSDIQFGILYSLGKGRKSLNFLQVRNEWVPVKQCQKESTAEIHGLKVHVVHARYFPHGTFILC